MLDIPEDDDDILGQAKKEAENGRKGPGVTKSKVADTTYYDALEVSPDIEPSKIKRQYYILARKYHPDKVVKMIRRRRTSLKISLKHIKFCQTLSSGQSMM